MSLVQNTFVTNEPALQEILGQIHCGKIQLPDFQRPWIWDDPHIRALLASVSMWYPIGAIMLLETGGNGARFRPRPFEGVNPTGLQPPELLVLDGQQRLTSLYLALRSGTPVPTRTEKDEAIQRHYYLDIAKCLEPDIDRMEAILGLPPDRILRSDFNRKVELDASSPEKEAERGIFPMARVFDTTGLLDWYNAYQKVHDFKKEKLELFMRFQAEVLQKFQLYRVPVIQLRKETPKEAVCQVFERVNTGGVSLTIFELMTATFAADDFQLQEDWKARSDRLKKREHTPLRLLEGTDFLTAVTLYVSFLRHKEKGTPVSCKRKDVLNLRLEDYRSCADLVEEGFRRAERFLVREMIFDEHTLPYRAQLIPLAAICTHLGDRFEEEQAREKIARWYWSGVLGELYGGGASETRFGLDMQEVIDWIEGGEEPRTVRDAAFIPTRLLSLQSRLSAAYKGIMALLMQVGSRDFLNGDPVQLTTYFERAIEIHHIFPRAWCERSKLRKEKWNSIVNKAALSERTNRLLGGKSPGDYCADIEKSRRIDGRKLNEYLESHLVDPALLRANDFDSFLRDRASRLLDLIERAMGKPVPGRDADETVQAFGGPLNTSGSPLPPRQAVEPTLPEENPED